MRQTGTSVGWTAAMCALVVAAVAGCGGGSPPSPPVGPPSAAPPGTPLGVAASALKIGPAGGSVTSSDGAFTVSLPAGAVSTDIDVTIEIITNTAPSAVGNAYRIAAAPPETVFAAPIALVFTAPAGGPALDTLAVATQDANGFWVRQQFVTRDAAAGTLTVTTTTLGDWAIVGAPTGRDLIGIFHVESTSGAATGRVPVTADGRSALNFHAGDATTGWYVQSGRITAATPFASGGQTCAPAAPTMPLAPNVAELLANPEAFRWAVDGHWELACGAFPPLAYVGVDTSGVGYLSCTRSYDETPLVTPEKLLGRYRIDCGPGGGSVAATWHFEICNQGEPCPSANPCHTAAITCDTGLPLCVDNGNYPNGLSCDLVPGVNEVCGDGVCNVCRIGEDCDPANVCNLGAYTCDTGFEVCTDQAEPDPSMTGQACDVLPGVPEVCGNGTCNACTAGEVCTPSVCNTGNIECGSGLPVCADTGDVAAGTVCDVDPGVDEVCFNGACNACTAGLACSTNPDPCYLGTTSCATGQQTCVDNLAAPEPVATACPGGVCDGAGTCNACTAGAFCPTNSNECFAGITSCATGAQTCENDVASPDAVATACTGGVCDGAGTCNACTAGVSCSTNPSECFAGVTSCSTGAQTCENDVAAPDAVATPCAGGVCDGAGVCNSCVAGLPCSTNPNECFAGITSCSTGAQTCEDDTAAPDAVAALCTGGVCDGTGVCNACTAGTSCSTNPNPCFAGTISCATGAPACLDDVLVPDPVATSCPGGVCDGAGVCNACTAGVSCSTNPNECLAGITSCSTGAQTCEDSPTAPDAVATPCTGGVCDGAGACNACTAGAPCSTNPNECFAGVTSCSTGAQTCEDDTAAPDEVASLCTGGVCDGAGVCNACAAGNPCATNSNECYAGITSCASGAQTCENDIAAPDPVATLCTGGVCDGAGTCNACTAGASCSANPNECFAGVTSCASGAQTCVDDTTAPDPIDTVCTGGFCDGAGVCSACVVGNPCSANPNECYAGVTTCPGGVETCVDDTAAPDAVATLCTGGVCDGAGACNACVAGTSCSTNPNECYAGVVSCATGSASCVSNFAAPDPVTTPCTGGVCDGAGVCNSCVAGVPCSTNPNECFAGVTSCATGAQTCVDDIAAPDPIATTCTGGVCNGSGVCAACTAGSACSTNSNECYAGITSCATGAQTCENDTSAPDPVTTPCTGGVCDGAGVCNACVAGTSCATNPNECYAGVVSCATGSATCVDNPAAPDPVTTPCTGGVCDGAGVCNSCVAGVPCSTNPNECFAGVTSCATGAQTCVDDIAAPDPIATTCTGGVCNGSGVCAACTAGSACSTNSNECYAGITSCATGAQTCENDTSAPDPVTTPCTGGVCDGAGVCNACVAGTSCATNPNECYAGVVSCAAGSATCVDNPAAPDPVTTPCTGGVCDGAGVCNACTAGDPCATNPNECFAGTTSCATGAPTCVDNTAAPDPIATTCTGGVCDGSGVCTACTAGIACSTNSNECYAGITSCATGAQTCENDTSAPDPVATPCTNGTCNGAGVCLLDRTVGGTRLARHWTTTGACSAAAPCSTEVVPSDVVGGIARVLARPTAGGTWSEIVGTISANGDYSIPNVPVGPYLLVLEDGDGVTHVIETSSSDVDLGYDVLGRSDAALATSPTLVTFDLIGLTPWFLDDEVVATAFDVDALDLPVAGADVLSGQTVGGAVEDWGASSVGRALNLLGGTDLLYLHQLSTETATDGVTAFAYQRATVTASAIGLPTTIVAALAPMTDSGTVTVSWDPQAFEALLPALGPAAAPILNPHRLLVETAPYASLPAAPVGAFGTPQLFRMVRPEGGASPISLSPITYGRFLDVALASEWRRAEFAAAVSYTAPAATSPLGVLASVGRRDRIAPAPPTPILPAIGPVQSPLVAGAPALGTATITGVGLTPTISWSAPTIGTPTRYEVRLFALAESGGATTARAVAAFQLTGTSVTVPTGPTGPLVSGTTYFAEITAYAVADERFDVAPLRRGQVFSHATTLTSPFTP